MVLVLEPNADDQFLPEVWALYAVGTLWLILRFGVRIRTVGFYSLQLDDAFAFIVLICWTIICVGIDYTYHSGTSLDFPPAVVAKFDQEHIETLIFGNKVYLVTWYAYITIVFSLKGTVIVFFQRLAFNKWQKIVLGMATVLCIAGFVTLILFLSLQCLPLSNSWRVWPPPSESCGTRPKTFITLSCFNALGDVLLLTIPIPMLWTLNLPTAKKCGLVVLLSSGIFVMAACIARVSLTVVPDTNVLIIARWGVRELAVGVVAVNTAMLRPMFRKSFWARSSPAARQERQRRSNYVFASLQRIRHIIAIKAADQRLESTSAGVSTIQWFNQGSTRNDSQYRDPDYIYDEEPRSGTGTLGSGLRSFARSWGRSMSKSQAKTTVTETVRTENKARGDADVEKCEGTTT